MAPWQLADYRDSTHAPDGFPTILIGSEEELRDALVQFSRREPAIIALRSPDGASLQIGMGGPCAGIRWMAGAGSQCYRVLLTDQACSPNRVDFAAEEDTIAFWPDELLPSEQALEVVLYYYRHQELPSWVAWKEWNPMTKKWEIRARLTNGAADKMQSSTPVSQHSAIAQR